MLKIYGIAFFLLGLLGSAWSQRFVTQEITQAIENGSRTTEGVPGENYFQNRSDYNIDVRFDPEKGKLRGDGTIVYYNNSSDTLSEIVIRLYQNISEKGALRNRAISKTDIHEGVKISRLKIEGTDYSDPLQGRVKTIGTNMIVRLSDIVYPGDSLQIEIRWSFTMPSEHLYRFGKYGDGNYFVAFWYPQIAVYDDIDGWDKLDYTGTQEFYNDFSKFEVKIHVPRNYLVQATGELQNAEKVFKPEIVSRMEKAGQSDEVIQIIRPENLEEKNFHTETGTVAYKYLADSVPDFAFSVSGNYLWDAASVCIDSVSGRRIMVMAVYAEGTTHFDSVVAIGRKAIHHLSYTSYGVPYPYPQVTVFSGEGGMEFPMMVNDGPTFIYNATLFVTLHEIAHAYFPFHTGINERVYSWIDEGLTTYLAMETELFLGSRYYSLERVAGSYNRYAGSFYDVPLYVSAMQTRDYAYQMYSYLRPAMAFGMLESYLGREVFRSAIQEFIRIWQYKHPTAYDLFAVIQNISEKDIDWLIDTWFFGSGYADQAIGWVSIDENNLRLQVKNIGSMPAPVVLNFYYEDERVEKIGLPIDIWKDSDIYIYSGQVAEGLEEIKLGSEEIPDKNTDDNSYIIK